MPEVQEGAEEQQRHSGRIEVKKSKLAMDKEFYKYEPQGCCNNLSQEVENIIEQSYCHQGSSSCELVKGILAKRGLEINQATQASIIEIGSFKSVGRQVLQPQKNKETRQGKN
uniref:Uncharacterized protein n=1 Tax=Romanomermis culicivorax TaxID=13658 RepID=A0A915KK86_ROMCU